ncbi:hypothetical protein [Neisseria musculi]|uniref:hypothetical protein n=1 Tax=Neisseria musculi TaxID=1815583 RepID=UPI00361A42D6
MCNGAVKPFRRPDALQRPSEKTATKRLMPFCFFILGGNICLMFSDGLCKASGRLKIFGRRHSRADGGGGRV